MTTGQAGVHKPLSISLPPVYFDILETMAHLQGREVEDLAQERLMQIIKEDIIFDQGFYGELLTKGWEDDLKDDEYFKDACGRTT